MLFIVITSFTVKYIISFHLHSWFTKNFLTVSIELKREILNRKNQCKIKINLFQITITIC